VHDQRLTGSPDGELADVCRAEGRVLVTLDTDFANIQRYPPAQHHGLIVLRLARQDKPFMSVIVGLLEREAIAGQLWIVEEGRVRIRGGE
jgi:hypothetical protein